MTEPALTALLSKIENPFVLGGVIMLLIVLTFSKKVAEVTGPLGALARLWNTRQVRRVERERALRKAQHERDREEDSAELGQLRTDVEWLRRELGDMRRREQLRDQQARAHSDWDNEWVPKARAAGIPVSDPPTLYLDLAPLHVPEEP